MPKEYTHWVLAEKAYRNLSDSRLKALLARNKNLYNLGAVVPDTPFYYMIGRRSIDFLSAGWRLHGHNGEDTFSFLPVVSRFFDVKNDDSVWAFLLGVMTHIVADGVFHPFIYYFSGNPLNHNPGVSRGAAFRHRMMETYLDRHYMRETAFAHSGKLALILKGNAITQENFIRLLSCLFFPFSDYPPKEIKSALRKHKFIQSQFYKRIYRNVLKATRIVPFFRLDEFSALFYPRIKGSGIPFFRGPIKYVHPVTGDKYQETLHDMESRVAGKCLRAFLIAERWRREGSPDSLNADLKGPSAYTGLYASKSADMIHFDIRNIPELLGALPSSRV